MSGDLYDEFWRGETDAEAVVASGLTLARLHALVNDAESTDQLRAIPIEDSVKLREGIAIGLIDACAKRGTFHFREDTPKCSDCRQVTAE